jgi:hypothetical protein
MRHLSLACRWSSKVVRIAARYRSASAAEMPAFAVMQSTHVGRSTINTAINAAVAGIRASVGAGLRARTVPYELPQTFSVSGK